MILCRLCGTLHADDGNGTVQRASGQIEQTCTGCFRVFVEHFKRRGVSVYDTWRACGLEGMDVLMDQFLESRGSR